MNVYIRLDLDLWLAFDEEFGFGLVVLACLCLLLLSALVLVFDFDCLAKVFLIVLFVPLRFVFFVVDLLFASFRVFCMLFGLACLFSVLVVSLFGFDWFLFVLSYCLFGLVCLWFNVC